VRDRGGERRWAALKLERPVQIERDQREQNPERDEE
jgi:hypothetical protein